MAKTLVVNHVPFEDLGYWDEILRRRGHTLTTVAAGVDPIQREALLGHDLVIILGGPISANDEAIFPFLAPLREAVSDRLERGGATLGICLGAQIMARSLGAAVQPMGHKEIGWSALELTTTGYRSPLRHLAEAGTAVLHWHGETFTTPTGAQDLAMTPACSRQAFAYGGHALALQFHPEVTAAGLERWFIGHIGEIEATAGISVPELRAATRTHAETLRHAGSAMLQEWLDAAAPGL